MVREKSVHVTFKSIHPFPLQHTHNGGIAESPETLPVQNFQSLKRVHKTLVIIEVGKKFGR